MLGAWWPLQRGKRGSSVEREREREREREGEHSWERENVRERLGVRDGVEMVCGLIKIASRERSKLGLGLFLHEKTKRVGGGE